MAESICDLFDENGDPVSAHVYRHDSMSDYRTEEGVLITVYVCVRCGNRVETEVDDPETYDRAIGV